MHRSDRKYLSRFALDPDPEYLDLIDFELDDEMVGDEFYDEIAPDDENEFLISGPKKNSKQPAMLKMDKGMY